MSRHISTLNYLSSAATCLTWTRTVMYWLSAPAITDSANKCHVFGGHFNPKSVARIQTCHRQFAQISVLSSGDQQAIHHVIERLMNHVIAANQPLHWLRLFYDITSEKSCIMFVQPAMSKNRTILSLYQRIEVLGRLREAHHVERLLLSQCGKTQIARMISKQTGKATWPTFGRIQVFAQLLCCSNFRFTNHSIHNYDNACIH